MISRIKNVEDVYFGSGSLTLLREMVDKYRLGKNPAVFLVDHFFKSRDLTLPLKKRDKIMYIDTSNEPTTEGIDSLASQIKKKYSPGLIVGVGGGAVLDTAKAAANLMTNSGKAEKYQGWDLLKKPSIPKIGVPTLSGTGAETSRTCVLMNQAKHLKLGMNSEFTLFDALILDPDISSTVPRGQYFYSGMDAYIHCIESLAGRHRNLISDACSREALFLCREIFSGKDMKTKDNREKMMAASYLGGSAIANSFVGLVHPFSAGLSMVYHLHHCVANCIVMNVMDEFYPDAVREFKRFMAKQKVEIPHGITHDADEKDFQNLYKSTIIHEKPLANALGKHFKSVLTYKKVKELFSRM